MKQSHFTRHSVVFVGLWQVQHKTEFKPQH